MKNLIISITLALSFCLLAACQQEPSSKVRIGIVIPLEHNAMNEIVAGFSDSLKTLYPQPVTIHVKNAQNDMNLQHSIIQQINDSDDTLIVTIGLATTQMATAIVHQKPVIGLAAALSDNDRKACHIALVHDEIPSIKLLDFIKAAYPDLKNITLVHSSADKVFPEVKDTIASGKKLGITVTPIMANTLPDLTSVAAAIPANTQAIIVLKDHLIVSGISLLAKKANELHIPVITLDQGSVENGATFALAVHERDIGVEGAKLATAILQGKSPCELPIVEMEKLTLFINKKSSYPSTLTDTAKKLQYSVEFVKASET